MPKTNKSGTPKQDELPSTLQRSEPHAQATFAKTYDSAIDTYDGDERRAAQTAYAAVKHAYEKVGDHWEPKDEAGPSDGGRGDNAGGVDAHASKQHLYELAQRLDVPGRSSMSKAELVEALDKANDRETARSRQ